MIWILIKLQLKSLYYSMFAKRANNKAKAAKRASSAGKGLGFGALAVYLIAIFAFFFGSLFTETAKILVPAGETAAYFSVALLFAVLFGVIGSVFITERTLFGAEDNDFLLSLPFKPSQILLSRMISLYAISLVYSLLVFIPALVVFGKFTSYSISMAICAALSVLIIPLISMTVTVILAWAFAAFTRRSKHKNLYTSAFSLVFLAAYMLFYTNLQSIVSWISAQPEFMMINVRRFALQIYFGSLALSDGKPVNILLYLLAALLPAAIVMFFLSKSFLKIATSSKSTAVYRYKKKASKLISVKAAMLKKELGKIFGTSAYFINSCFGAFLLLIASVAVAIKGSSLLSALTADGSPFMGISTVAVTSILATVIATSLCMLTNTTNVSLSLEGVNFDFLKSLPLSYKDVVLPKIAANMVIGYTPALLFAIVAIIRMRLPIAGIISLILVPFLAQLFAAAWGMYINLCFPNFSWTSEAAVVKQSVSCMISVFSGLGMTVLYALAAVIIMVVIPDKGSAVLLSTVGSVLFFAILNLICFALLLTSGKKKYKKL